MELTALLERIAQDPDCAVFPAIGQPHVDASQVVPDDLRVFYDMYGGIRIGRGSFYEARIVAPDRCMLANDVILGPSAAVVRERQPRDPSWNWYVIAEVENGNFLSIDFGRAHNGRCYDSLEETYGLTGQMPVIAESFTALIEQLYENKGKHWYWLEPSFQPLGDAYDVS